ncbi:MAG: hypothetical protein EBS74_06625 [Flavobacteriia bacterium]|nr:hypothetical protein [Flavobacteriia bacterium]
MAGDMPSIMIRLMRFKLQRFLSSVPARRIMWGLLEVNSGIKENQTLYSFRHSGAIDIFKRSGSITKLQKAMGHSSINVSLTYLRGLEVPELNEEDMPMI